MSVTSSQLLPFQRVAMPAKSIRVLQLGNPTGLYGAERWILALAKHLHPQQVESIVATIKDAPGGMPPLCREALGMGLRTEVFESHGKLSFGAIGLINSFIRANRVDILHTHGYKTDMLGRCAALGTGCKVVATPHGWSTREGIKVQIYESLDRLALYFFDAVAPLSTELCAGLGRLPGLRRKLHLIGNGVDLTELNGVTTPAPELMHWRSRGDRIIGYIGRLIRLKGIDTLIRAFSALPFANRRLCIIGEGPQRAELRALVEHLGESERVHFFGYRPDRIALLRGFDVFVLPSAHEGTPRCVLEAMALGVPVIGTDHPGCRTLIGPGATGLLFQFGDATGLAEALVGLFADERRRDALSKAARDLVYTQFSAEMMAARYTDLYREILLNTAAAKRCDRARWKD
jgi:glycosyltransferase involved in cell wall biosynthesis